jgi:hypothetical protein
MKKVEEIKTNPKPAFYAVLLESFRKIALDKGYALAVHGTMASDMDLLAVAWVEDACTHEELANAIWEEMSHTIWEKKELFPPESKPNNRIAYTIPIIGDWYIDLSIIPPIIND